MGEREFRVEPLPRPIGPAAPLPPVVCKVERILGPEPPAPSHAAEAFKSIIQPKVPVSAAVLGAVKQYRRATAPMDQAPIEEEAPLGPAGEPLEAKEDKDADLDDVTPIEVTKEEPKLAPELDAETTSTEQETPENDAQKAVDVEESALEDDSAAKAPLPGPAMVSKAPETPAPPPAVDKDKGDAAVAKAPRDGAAAGPEMAPVDEKAEAAKKPEEIAAEAEAAIAEGTDTDVAEKDAKSPGALPKGAAGASAGAVAEPPPAEGKDQPGTKGAEGSGGGDATVAAWTGRVQAAVKAMPTPSLPPSTTYTGGMAKVGGAAAAKQEKKAEEVPKEAKKVLEAHPPKALADIPPIPSPDPVPEATKLVQDKSVRSLPDQKLPDLITSPHGFKPTVGGPPLDTNAPPPAPVAAGPAGTPATSKTPADAVNKTIATPPQPVPVSGQGQTITGSDRPPVHTVADVHKGDIAKVLARVYLGAATSASAVVKDAKAQAYPGVDLNGAPELADLGSDLVESETTWFQEEMGRVAEAANIGKKGLDDAVEGRKKELADEKAQASTDIQKVSTEQTEAVTKKAADTKATIKSVRQQWEEHWDAVAADAKGGVDPKVVRGEQEKHSEVLRKHAADHIVAWTGMQKEREKKLDRAAEDQVTAYKDAALADQCAQRQASEAELTDEALKKWVLERAKDVGTSNATLKADLKKTVDGWQTEMRTARDAALEKVRDWADRRIGRERGWFEKLIDMLFGELETKQEETAAFADAQTEENVTSLGEDLQLINDLKMKGDEGLDRDGKEHLQTMDKEQQALLMAYFKGEGAEKGDSVLFLAKMMELRLKRQRKPEVTKKVVEKIKALDNVKYWQSLNAIGKAQNSGFDAQKVGDLLWQAFEYTWGTDEDKAYNAVAGLTLEQGKATRGAYWLDHGQLDHGRDLDTRLTDEMSGEEYDRVKFGLDGKKTEADAAALRDAVQGAGTNEELINKTLRNKTPAERKAIADSYRSLYGEDLKARLDDELNDDERAITDALWEGNSAKADAFEIKQAKDAFWGPDKDKIEGVYNRVREEATAEGDQKGLTSAEIDADVARRSGLISEEYKGVTKRDLLPDLEKAFSPPAGREQDQYADQYWKGRRDLVLGMATGDLTRADAGKIQIERTGIYAKDDTINAVLALQYDRAFERTKRDALVAFNKANGRSPNKKEMADLEKKAADDAQVIGQQKMAALGTYFEANYTKGTESFKETIKDLTQGVGEDKAVALLDQGGKLKDWQVLEFSTKGAGTDDDAFKKLLKSKKTKAEMDQLERDWLANTKQTKGYFGSKPFGSLKELIDEETSGRLQNDLSLDYKYGGDPEDPKVLVDKAKDQLDFERRSGGVDTIYDEEGNAYEVKNHEYQVLEKRLARLQKEQADYDKILSEKLPDDDPRKAWATLKWQGASEGFQSAVETHRAMVDQRTELAAQVVSMVTAVAVGVLITALTGGAGGPLAVALIAGVSSLFGAAAGIATKASMKGAAYGADELGVDIAVGIVDTVVSAATAGFGDKLLKSAKGAAKLGSTGFLATLGRMAEGNMAQRATAHFIAEGAEGFLQSLPTSVLSTALNEQTWKEGNPFLNMLGGVGMGVGMGTLASGTMGALTHLKKPKGGIPHEPPHVGASHELVDAHGSPTKLADLEARYFEAHPTRTQADFRSDFDGVMLKQAEHDPAVAKKLKDQLHEEITDLLPAHHKEQLAGTPIEMWDKKRFEEFTGSAKGQAVVIIKDGKPTVIVKQGAHPHALGEEGFHLVQALDPKTQAKMAKLDEAAMGRWPSMDAREKLTLYKEKVDLEIDAQKQVIASLEERAKVPGAAEGMAERLSSAKETLGNLEKRFAELERIGPFQRTLMGLGVLKEPEWLDQPARLFAKADLKTERKLIAAALAGDPPLHAAVTALDGRLGKNDQAAFLQMVRGTLSSADPAAAAAKVKQLVGQIDHLLATKGAKVDLSPLASVALKAGNADDAVKFIKRMDVIGAMASSPSKNLKALAGKALSLADKLGVSEMEEMAQALRRIQGAPDKIRNDTIKAIVGMKGSAKTQHAFIGNVGALLDHEGGHLLLSPALKSKKMTSMVDDAAAILASPNMPSNPKSRAAILEGIAPGRFPKRKPDQILANVRKVLEDPRAEELMQHVAQSRFVGRNVERLEALGARLATLKPEDSLALLEGIQLTSLGHRTFGVSTQTVDRAIELALTGEVAKPGEFLLGAHKLFDQAQHGVSAKAITNILERAGRGTPDLHWLGGILDKGRLEPWVLEHLASIDNFAWNSVKKGTLPGATAKDVSEAMSKLRGAVGEYIAPHAVAHQLGLPAGVEFSPQVKGTITGTDVDLMAKWVEGGHHFSQSIEVKAWGAQTWEDAVEAWNLGRRDPTLVNVAKGATGAKKPPKPIMIPKGLADHLEALRKEADQLYKAAKKLEKVDPEGAKALLADARDQYQKARALAGGYGKLEHLQTQLESATKWHLGDPEGTKPPLLVTTTDLDHLPPRAARLYEEFMRGMPEVMELRGRIPADWIDAYLDNFAGGFGIKKK